MAQLRSQALQQSADTIDNIIGLLETCSDDNTRIGLVKKHFASISINHFISVLNTFKTDPARGDVIDLFFEALFKDKEENNAIFIEALNLFESDIIRFGCASQYIRTITFSLRKQIITAIFKTLVDEENRYYLLTGCMDTINPNLFFDLLSQLSYSNRLEFVLELKKDSKVNNNTLSLAQLFPEVFPSKDPQALSALVKDLSAFVQKERRLLSVVQLLDAENKIEFLKLFNSSILLQSIHSQEDWAKLKAEYSDQRVLIQSLGLPLDDSFNDLINLIIALNQLTDLSSKHISKQLYTDEKHKIAAGQYVARAFREALYSGHIRPEELKNLKEVVELITTSIKTKNNDMQPLLDKLKAHPIRIGEQRTRRIVFGAIAAFICAALVAASIGLAVISFGAAAPLTIAGITLGANIVTAAVAASTAPVAAGLACGSTLFAVSGRKIGLALAVDKFIDQRSAQP